MSKKLVVVLIIFLATSAIALLHSISPYTTPSEIAKLGEAKNVQVVGRMLDLRYENGTTTFRLSDGRSYVNVIYRGKLSYFDSEVVVIGDWNGSALIAKEILRKCHTQYGG